MTSTVSARGMSVQELDAALLDARARLREARAVEDIAASEKFLMIIVNEFRRRGL
ncbi:hypothetical protein QMK17_12640 [Rhodococcus sp. G-MC3]|uniref:hypothetical protein n=1 Tax=Rhodococcus sp. G-MC3 TaxID=3046209 RepID=UPI0024BB65DD|nr:hypothetical protein [Rhodococcus sp. G-MC3]MDJ0394176.1 hypothetical protein [Rhodococcus sp. G-MC3]